MAKPILLVDPEARRRHCLEQRLVRQGWSVVAADGLSAERLTRGQGVQVVLVDLALLCEAGPDSLTSLVRSASPPDAVLHCSGCGRSLVEESPGRGVPECCGRPMLRSGEPTEVAARPNETVRVGNLGVASVV